MCGHVPSLAQPVQITPTSILQQIALEAASFWQDVYLSTLLSLPSTTVAPAAAAPGAATGGGFLREAVLGSPQHVSLLQHLASLLVWRTALQPAEAAAATADARDVPEETRMVHLHNATCMSSRSLLRFRKQLPWAQMVLWHDGFDTRQQHRHRSHATYCPLFAGEHI